MYSWIKGPIRKIAILPLLAVWLLLGACAGDDELHVEPSRESLSSPGGNVVDLEPTPFGSPTHEGGFWTRAVMSGMTNVKFSEIALEKVKDPEIRQFAERMIRDHTNINEQLTSLASRKNIALPTDLDPEHQVMRQKMQGVSAPEFAGVYVDTMVRAHEDAVQLYERQAETEPDPDVKAFAEKTLPVLRDHLERIRVINANLK